MIGGCKKRKETRNTTGKNREEVKASRTMNERKWGCNRNNYKDREEYNGVTKRIKEENLNPRNKK